MRVRLIDIIYVPEAWQTAHRIRAIAIDGRSPALAQLHRLSQTHPEDFRKLLKVLGLVAQNERVRNENHVKRCANDPNICEMRGGNARLFFFYARDAHSIVVCTNCCWKAKGSRREQNEAFEKARRLRIAFLAASRDNREDLS